MTALSTVERNNFHKTQRYWFICRAGKLRSWQNQRFMIGDQHETLTSSLPRDFKNQNVVSSISTLEKYSASYLKEEKGCFVVKAEIYTSLESKTCVRSLTSIKCLCLRQFAETSRCNLIYEDFSLRNDIKGMNECTGIVVEHTWVKTMPTGNAKRERIKFY